MAAIPTKRPCSPAATAAPSILPPRTGLHRSPIRRFPPASTASPPISPPASPSVPSPRNRRQRPAGITRVVFCCFSPDTAEHHKNAFAELGLAYSLPSSRESGASRDPVLRVPSISCGVLGPRFARTRLTTSAPHPAARSSSPAPPSPPDKASAPPDRAPARCGGATRQASAASCSPRACRRRCR